MRDSPFKGRLLLAGRHLSAKGTTSTKVRRATSGSHRMLARCELLDVLPFAGKVASDAQLVFGYLFVSIPDSNRS